MIRISQMLAMSFLLFLQTKELKAQTNIVKTNEIFTEKNGLVAVEAEHFFKQTRSDVRKWYRFSNSEEPSVKPDVDSVHHLKASNNTYLELLPDTRATHDDSLIRDENFSGGPGKMAVLHYKIKFETPGRYFVWVRAYSTGTEDNGLHVGFNDKWPETGARMQWCDGKYKWTWASKQRTDQHHCGEPGKIYLDIDKAGEHEIMYSMREDGFEFDKFILTTDKNYTPSQN